jgi:4-hydroxybenzoate polyprenyltransferase
LRPLPSGRVSALEAVLLLGILFGAGLSGAFLVRGASFLVAAFLLLLIISYDAFTKDRHVIGPLNMGACRACNLLLGMSGGQLQAGTAMLFPFLTLAYVFTLTTLSRFEVHNGLGKQGWIVFGGWAGVVAAILGLGLAWRLSGWGLMFLSVFALFTGPTLVLALLQPTPAAVGRAVKFLILGIPLLDAVYSAGIQGWPYGIIVGLCMVPAVFFARYLYVT